MKTKRDKLAVLWCKDHQFSEKDRGDAFKAGWDAAYQEFEQKLNKAIEALKDAADYRGENDVNGEAGYIAWKALKEIKGSTSNENKN